MAEPKSSAPETPAPPAKAAPIATVEMVWEAVPGAKSYEMEIQADNFEKRFESKTPKFSVQIPLGTYKARGRTQDMRGIYGEWSKFETIATVPQKVDLKSSMEMYKPKIRMEGHHAWVKVQWKPIAGVKT